MNTLSKLCDGADWFDPVFEAIVRNELGEGPRFHRKQWEFAQIFRALRALGRLEPSARGLSMASGTERLLYAVAAQVGHLTVTDLYGSGSAWDCAQMEDPESALRANAPFPIDPSRITARRMDMRSLEFADATFDFCYSSCAIEHIGEHDDFVRHLGEVRRVLKDDGVYALTTEFHYGDEVIRCPNNYYFPITYLGELLAETGLVPVGSVDGRIWRHSVNSPVPANLDHLCHDPSDDMTGMLLRSTPHLQLLVGGHPFTSLCLVLAKTPSDSPAPRLAMIGLDESRGFIASGVDAWRSFVERSHLRLDPCAAVDGGSTSRCGVPRLVSHEGAQRGAGDTALFHSGYVWLGSGRRSVAVDAELWPDGGHGAAAELRVHCYRTLDPTNVVCAHQVPVAIGDRTRIRTTLDVACDEGWCYAVLGHVTAGACWVDRVRVDIGSARR